MSLQVYFYEAFEEEGEAIRRYLPPHIRAGFTDKTIQEKGDLHPPAPLISFRTQSVLPPSWSKSLSGIVSRSTGYDHLIGLDVPCGHLPLYCSRAVAEQAILLVMALMRKFPRQMEQFWRFHRDGLTGAECQGKNLLVVGVGNIGSEVVKIGQGLGMAVRGVDLVQRHSWVDYVSRNEGLGWADAIVCAMNLTGQNRGYFDYATLARAKPGAFLVNIARGEMVPVADLVRILDEGKLGGAALDVHEREPEMAVAMRSGRYESPLRGRPNVILTPHNAFNTAEGLERKARQAAEQAVHFIEHGTFIWPAPTSHE